MIIKAKKKRKKIRSWNSTKKKHNIKSNGVSFVLIEYMWLHNKGNRRSRYRCMHSCSVSLSTTYERWDAPLIIIRIFFSISLNTIGSLKYSAIRVSKKNSRVARFDACSVFPSHFLSFFTGPGADKWWLWVMTVVTRETIHRKWENHWEANRKVWLLSQCVMRISTRSHTHTCWMHAL